MRVYIAGKYSADNVLDVLGNIHDGIKASAEVLKYGMAPFCPFLDYQFHFFDKTLNIQWRGSKCLGLSSYYQIRKIAKEPKRK